MHSLSVPCDALFFRDEWTASAITAMRYQIIAAAGAPAVENARALLVRDRIEVRPHLCDHIMAIKKTFGFGQTCLLGADLLHDLHALTTPRRGDHAPERSDGKTRPLMQRLNNGGCLLYQGLSQRLTQLVQ